jgi:hypothetical protein
MQAYTALYQMQGCVDICTCVILQLKTRPFLGSDSAKNLLLDAARGQGYRPACLGLDPDFL